MANLAHLTRSIRWQQLAGRLRWLCLLLLSLLILNGCQDTLRRLTGERGITPVPLPSRTLVSPTVGAESTPVPANALQDLPAEDQLLQMVVPTRDLRDLTLRLNPQVDEVPLVVNATPPSYTVGDELSFWVQDSSTNLNSKITAKLVYKTDVAYVWVQTGQQYDERALKHSIDRFSQQSYPAEVAFFGSEWYPGVDDDPRVHILHTVATGNGVAGYYSSADEYSRLANPYSNEKEMFYINLNTLSNAASYTYYETVLAHEFQHMIHWSKDRNEETWINEGLSEYAQEVAGYDPDTGFAVTFINNPDTQLNTWGIEPADRTVHYGSSYLFINYLTQRFGQETTKAMVAEPANGIQGVTDALRERGYSQDFNALFADWVIANYVEDPDALGLDGRYGYRNIDLPKPPLADTLHQGSAYPYQATVNNYAADYIAIDPANLQSLDFSGGATTRLVGADPYSGNHAWWGNRSDDSNSRLTRRFDLSALAPGAPVAMDVAMWWNIEQDYDYGYVEASRDGQKWQILPGQHTTTENPTGNSFGAGYTGKSSAAAEQPSTWMTERFDLSDYAGAPVWLRFEYVTDDAVTASGWLIDDIRIPALDYATDFEQNDEGWESEGWLLSDNQLTQHWLLQLLEFDGDTLAAVHQIPVDEQGHAHMDLADLAASGRQAVLVVSAYAPATTEPASYELTLH
ncbi:MAG: immune inhibitor A [Caldilineaceae bacterium]